ncbi:hypothetical protein ACFE04_027857 [Oxalis oulophora]
MLIYNINQSHSIELVSRAKAGAATGDSGRDRPRGGGGGGGGNGSGPAPCRQFSNRASNRMSSYSKLQKLIGHCAPHLKESETHQGPAHGEQNIRRAVPLALGLLSISNPKVGVMEILSRFIHDTDSEVSMVF